MADAGRNRPDRPGDEPRTARSRSGSDSTRSCIVRVPLSATLRDHYRRMWQQLRAENAALRIIRDDRLQSAPITHFDQLVHCLRVRASGSRSPGWSDRRWSKPGMTTAFRPAISCSPRASGRWSTTGQLEYRGDLADWRHCEMRLPAGAGDGPTSPVAWRACARSVNGSLNQPQARLGRTALR